MRALPHQESEIGERLRSGQGWAMRVELPAGLGGRKFSTTRNASVAHREATPA
jgi:hypothetical protein